MAFNGITVDTIVGDATSGVQALFPRFTFDDASNPSIGQLREYARAAIATVNRAVRFKGYDPANIADADDLEFVKDWIRLVVAAEVHTVLDQFKDNKVANVRFSQLQSINALFDKSEDPFPSVSRAATSEAQDAYPSRVVRG